MGGDTQQFLVQPQGRKCRWPGGSSQATTGRCLVLLRKWVKAESGHAVMFGGALAFGMEPSLAGMIAAQMEEVQPEPLNGWWLWL